VHPLHRSLGSGAGREWTPDKIAGRVGRLPRTLLGWVDADGLLMVVRARSEGACEVGLRLATDDGMLPRGWPPCGAHIACLEGQPVPCFEPQRFHRQRAAAHTMPHVARQHIGASAVLEHLRGSLRQSSNASREHSQKRDLRCQLHQGRADLETPSFRSPAAIDDVSQQDDDCDSTLIGLQQY